MLFEFQKGGIYMKKILKRFIGAMVLCAMCVCMLNTNLIEVKAAPAPSLKQIGITDITVDEYNKIYIEVTEIGTSKNRYVYCNNTLLTENYNEMVMVDLNGDRIVDGYKRYFYTGYTLNQLYSGLRFNVRVQYTNAMSPWNTLTASKTFTFN